MKIGFLFPGQGAQVVGMGKDLYDNYESVRKVYELANSKTSKDLCDISFNGPENVLNTTRNTQLCTLAMSLGIVSILNKENIKASMTAGLSLGEYTALSYSGVITYEDVFNLVNKRGKYMQEEVPFGSWKMAAVIGLEDTVIKEVVNEIKSKTNLFIAISNYNCIGQTVIAGEEEAILEASKLLKINGARKVIVLNTNGPFHTSKLEKASYMLRSDLNKVSYNKFNVPIVKNIDGNLYSDDDDIEDILAKHMINPVKFTSCIKTMFDNDIDTFIEIGPGKVLSGFVRKMSKELNRNVTILNINNIESLESTIKYLKNEGE